MIDTLAIASDLVAAGVAKPQAEAHARAIATAVGQQYADIATKDFVRSEISALRAELREEIGALRTEVREEISAVRGEISAVRGEMSALETRLVRWIVGTMIAGGGLLFAALHFIP